MKHQIPGDSDYLGREEGEEESKLISRVPPGWDSAVFAKLENTGEE